MKLISARITLLEGKFSKMHLGRNYSYLSK